MSILFRIWINFLGQTGHLRRLPGWPNEELHHLLLKFATYDFGAPCDGGDGTRRISDEKVALNSKGPLCGTCHVVIFKHNI